MVKITKKELETQVKEHKDTLQRLQAEFENYQKRIDKEKSKFLALANKDLLLKLLNLADNFELSLKDSENNEFTKGIKLILKQLNKILEESNVIHIKSLGGVFDPNKHEVLQQVSDKEKQDQLIIEELQKGYSYGDYVLRHSKVKIINNGVKNV